MSAQKHLLLVRNASQIVQVCSNREERLVGAAMKEIVILNAELSEGLSVAVGADGNILCLGRDSEVARALEGSLFAEVIDARGSSVVPGLVDAHTHPVWVGDRVHEFAMKVEMLAFTHTIPTHVSHTLSRTHYIQCLAIPTYVYVH